MKPTDYLACYGAILSTIVFIRNAVAAQPRVRVRVAFSIETKNGATRSGLGVSIQNPSAHPVRIVAVSFLYPLSEPTLKQKFKHVLRYRRAPWGMGWCSCAFSLRGVEDGCPITIEPHSSHYIMVPQDKIEGLLAEATRRVVKVSVQDALWQNKSSREFVFPRRKSRI